MRKRLIIDGHNLLHRAFWAYKKNESEFKNDNANSVYVFLNILKSYVRLFEPSEILVCWDYNEFHTQNERKEILKEYKEQRPDHSEVYKYLPSIMSILQSLGIKQLTPKSFEADDIMYWLCAVKYPNECILVTTDSDMYQLITPQLEGNIFYNPKKKMQLNCVYLKQKYGVSNGYEFIIKKALRGDTADNISGVKNIRQSRIEQIIECLGNECDLDALKKSDLLKPDDLKIFERNLLLMKLDEVMNHPNEIEWYEECLNKEVIASKDKFRLLIKELELWNIYRKTSEWFSAFQPKSNEYNNTYQYPFSFNDLFT